jgi:hypothetical protein
MSINNDGKSTTWRIVDIAMILVLALLGSLWAVTWKGTEKKAVEAAQLASEACKDVQLTKEFIAAQKEINKNINEKLDDILTEVRKN